MTTAIAEVPQEKLQAMQTKSMTLTTEAKEMVIADRTAFEKARDIIVKIIRPALKEVADAFDQQINDFYKGHKNAIAMKNRYALDFETAEDILSLKMKAWEKEEFARQEAERRRIEREQEDRARMEREDLPAQVRAVVHQLRMTTERELASRRVGEFVMADLDWGIDERVVIVDALGAAVDLKSAEQKVKPA